MFTIVCTAISCLLFMFAANRYLLTSLIVAIEFIACTVAYNYCYLALELVNDYQLYLTYALIQFAAISALSRTKSHLFIMLLMYIALILNCVSAYLAFNATTSIINYNNYLSIYSVYTSGAGAIMILQLIYQIWISEHVNRLLRKRRFNADNSDRLFNIASSRLLLGKIR